MGGGRNILDLWLVQEGYKYWCALLERHRGSRKLLRDTDIYVVLKINVCWINQDLKSTLAFWVSLFPYSRWAWRGWDCSHIDELASGKRGEGRKNTKDEARRWNIDTWFNEEKFDIFETRKNLSKLNNEIIDKYKMKAYVCQGYMAQVAELLGACSGE